MEDLKTRRSRFGQLLCCDDGYVYPWRVCGYDNLERERKHPKTNPIPERDVMDATPHEIIVVDDNSSDGTFSIAKRLADVAVVKKREGQTKRLLHGMQLAKYPVIITIDSDLENDPKHIPALIKQMIKYQFDVVVASRTHLPQISEIVTSKTLGRLV